MGNRRVLGGGFTAACRYRSAAIRQRVLDAPQVVLADSVHPVGGGAPLNGQNDGYGVAWTLRAVMNVALNDLSRMPPHDVAIELAGIARRAWDGISALIPLDDL
jgi:hypothetical protein